MGQPQQNMQTPNSPTSAAPSVIKLADLKDKIDAATTHRPRAKAREGTHVASDTTITFTDIKGRRVHAQHGEYVSPCHEDLRSLVRRRAIVDVKSFEALEALRRTQAEIDADVSAAEDEG